MQARIRQSDDTTLSACLQRILVDAGAALQQQARGVQVVLDGSDVKRGLAVPAEDSQTNGS